MSTWFGDLLKWKFSSWLHCFAERLWIPNTTTCLTTNGTKSQLIMNPAEILKYTLSTWLEYHSLRAGKYILYPGINTSVSILFHFEGNLIINLCCMLNYTYDCVTFFHHFLSCAVYFWWIYVWTFMRVLLYECMFSIYCFFDSVFFADTCNAYVFINSSVSSTYFCVSSKRGWVNGTILWSVSIKQKLWGFYNCKIIKIKVMMPLNMLKP